MDCLPLVSVIIITYNQEDYIARTIDSILMQETSFPIEIIIGEDCSSDKTADIVRQYEKKYPFIKALCNLPNKGLIKNYFDTVFQSQGKYIAQCAGDDYWTDPLKLQKQVDFLEANPDYGMVHTRCNRFIQETQKEECWDYANDKNTFKELINKNSIAALTVCYRKDLFNRYINEVNPLERKWLMEDYPMWIWFSLNSKIKFLKDNTATYRIFDESISHSKNTTKAYKFLLCEWEVRLFFGKDNLTPQEYDDMYLQYIHILQFRSFFFKDKEKQKEVTSYYKRKNILIYWSLKLFYLFDFLWSSKLNTLISRLRNRNK